ncbi:MAG TPA: phytanoyl-CoA dioxygenase family protein [Acidimicrobiales bacterium]|nr:phytanoyl-CoA dioxygenase family protein [Acidimicrobiales bacterium]
MTATPNPAALLSPEELAHFRDRGYLLLRGVLSEGALASVQRVMEQYVDELARRWTREGWISDPCEELDFTRRYASLRAQLPPRFSNTWRRVLVSRALWSLWQEPALLGAARSIVDDDVYAHGIWNGRPRTSHESMKVAWHQDAHYYSGYHSSHDPMVTCWIPFVPVDEASGCLQIVPGSHRGGMVPAVRTGHDGQRTVAPQVLDNLAAAGMRPLSCAMEPGDVLLFDACMLHQSLHNRAATVRWSLDLRYCRRDVGEQHGGPGYVCFAEEAGGPLGTYEEWAAQYAYDGTPLIPESTHDTVARLAEEFRIPVSELTEF